MAKTSRRDFLLRCTQAGALVSLGALGRPAEATSSAGTRTTLIKGPYLHIQGDGEARLRFETSTTDPLQVRLESPGTETQLITATVRVDDVKFYWPRGSKIPKKKSVPFKDERGKYGLQEVIFRGLPAGETCRWTVELGDSKEVTGTFKASPSIGTPFRIGWFADTRQPRSHTTMSILLKSAPDLVLHGGDIQYQSDGFDTWNGFFNAMQGIMRRAPVHMCPGNHEYEGMDEFNTQYLRLFDGHGDGSAKARQGCHAFSYGGVRFLMLNSEKGLTNPSDWQVGWLKQELEAIEHNSALRYAVVGMHRPIFSFSKRQPPPGMRDVLHPLFTKHRVPLVLTGHNHCYEHFEVDGVTYITDGGGGASLYDVNHRLARVERKHPEQLSWRKAYAKSHGATIIDFKADGAIYLRRENFAGEINDEFEIKAR